MDSAFELSPPPSEIGALPILAEATPDYYEHLRDDPRMTQVRNLVRMYANPMDLFSHDQAEELLQQTGRSEIGDKPWLIIGLSALGENFIADSVVHRFNEEVLNDAYTVVHVPKQYKYLSPFHILWSNTGYLETTRHVLPIQQVYANELAVIFNTKLPKEFGTSLPSLHEMRFGNDYIKPKHIRKEGTAIAEKVQCPIILILQAGSEPAKRFSDDQKHELKQHAHDTYPDSRVIVVSDAEHPTLNELGALGYAVGKTGGQIWTTDTGPAWITTAAAADANPESPKNVFVLTTVAIPDVWGIPGVNNIVSPAVHWYQHNDPSQFAYGAMEGQRYAAFYGVDATRLPSIQPGDFSLFLDSLPH